jgi:methylmalonyl-CoA mutase N-terminal domain/subunit
VQACLGHITADAKSGANVMPAIMAAVKAYATVGEMNAALVEVYGRYQEPIRF